MPGISGSTVAPKQARFGVARFGASRFGDYQPRLRVLINGVDRTALVRLDSLAIVDRLNNGLSEASLTLRGGTILPHPGYPLVISLGNATDRTRLFGGFILTTYQHQAHAGQEITYQVSAKDYTWFLDKQLSTKKFVDATVSDIVRTLIADIRDPLIASGWDPGFSVGYIEPDLDTLDEFTVTNERLSAALTRLANAVGGGWYVNAHGEIWFFQSAIDLPDPSPLSSSNLQYWDLQAEFDNSQIRTRAVVEGKRTTVPLGLPADAYPNGTYLPMESSDGFRVGSPSGSYEARYGPELITYGYVVANALAQEENPPGATVTSLASPGDTQLAVSDNTWINSLTAQAGGLSPQFVRVGEQVLFFSSGGADTLANIPSSGYGAIQAPIAVGTAVQPVATMWAAFVGDQDHPPGDELVVREVVDDFSAQFTVNDYEGGDGRHDVIVQDDRLGYAECVARANAELAAASSTIRVLSYKTRHPSAASGRVASASLTAPTSLTGTFLIREVTISGFDQMAPRTARNPRVFPIRTVHASLVQRSRTMDQLTTGEDVL